MSLDTADSEKIVVKNIRVMCAITLRHATQQNYVKNYIPKTVRSMIQKKVAGLELNLQCTTKYTNIQVNPTEIDILKRQSQKWPTRLKTIRKT